MAARALAVENQHWIPRFLLRNFADLDGRVFRLGVEDDIVTKPPPKFAAARPNFNLLLSGGAPVSFEARFQTIETAAAPPIKDVLAARSLATLSEKQRHAIAAFIAAQSFRTEAYRKGLDAADRRTDPGETWERLWDSLPYLAAMVGRRHWALMETEPENLFYLGDSPVVLQSTERPGDAMELGFDLPGVEAFLPLSPTLALYLPCPATCDEIIDGYHSALWMSAWPLGRAKLRSAGRQDAIRLAERAIATSGSLYRSLAQGVPFAADPENVENLNYLQCAWSSSAIYSRQPDFSFARRVFGENPGYRKAMPVRLVSRFE
jgi:hypothetical protein